MVRGIAVPRRLEAIGGITMNRMNTDQILQALSKSPAEGMSLMALARSTGKSLPELQKFLRAHRICFHEVEQTKYKINPNPPINGDLESAKFHLQRENSKQRQWRIMRWAGLSSAIFVTFYLLSVLL
tara:strand:+ start:31 stop:411 length:381 start_codon:yes stop_codon:yes gene_type:complete